MRGSARGGRCVVRGRLQLGGRRAGPLRRGLCLGHLDADAVAETTLEVFNRHVPAAVPGIVFLSGGQTDEDATAHLNAMNAKGPHPWQLSFSYGRALQAPALKAWGGTSANFAAGQKEFSKRAKLNGLATTGQYTAAMESQAA